MSMGMQILGDGRPDGSSVGASSTELAGFHGKAVAQYSNIAVVTASITSNGITACWDIAAARINSLISAVTLKGIVAAS